MNPPRASARPLPNGLPTGPAVVLYLGIPVAISFWYALSQAGVLARHFPFPLALACWMSILLPRWWLQELATRVLHRLLARWRPPLIVLLTGGACLGAALCQPYAIWSAGWFQATFPQYLPLTAPSAIDWTWQGYAARFVSTLPLQLLAVLPWVVANVIHDRVLGLRRFAYESVPPAPVAAPSADAPGADGIVAPLSFASKLRRLDATEIIAVEAADHFIRVHSRTQSEMIYCQFGEAVDELAARDGLRVHRSWWVARDAIASVGRSNGNPSLQLVNGTEIPVGRSFLPAVREAAPGQVARRAISRWASIPTASAGKNIEASGPGTASNATAGPGQ